MAKERRLKKDLASVEGSLVIEVIGGVSGKVIFNPQDLPKEVQEKLPALALSHKLGDSAAGCSGAEAEEAIQKVWEGMLDGKMSVRKPGQKKVGVDENDIIANLSKLSPTERAGAEILLKSMGIVLPEVPKTAESEAKPAPTPPSAKKKTK